ncbi:hypothetical protein Vadar_004590 [Vaccinium darrowii]|uniref:Uncharacterized protein n=1 Tax=Vaccinium darrowii TaxID=229202 RepID=A0ACB7Z440_9ERIC|nr:hypothetical protein Vadar_004590 [Vaccinium darrowii]
MGKKAGPAKAKRHIGVGPSQEPTKTLGKRPAIEPNEEEERKKKQREDEERTEKEKWVAKMQKRVFTCERQLNPKGLGTHPVIAAIRYHGLSFFFDNLGCYRRKMVKNFYENMVVHRRERVVVSQVGKVIVEVTPDSIANYLHYERPADGTSTYPRNPLKMPPNEQVHTLTDAPDSFDPESGRYIAGSLRAKYRTVNKLVHHNLSPFSLDKTPTSYDGKVMIVFGSEKEKVD